MTTAPLTTHTDGSDVAGPPGLRPVDPRPPRVPTVHVGRLPVSNLGQQGLVGSIVDGALATSGTRPYVAFAVHVGGLNAQGDEEYLASMRGADIVYADGVSVALLARLAGASAVEKCGTTDIGWDVLRRLGARLRRPVRVALVGGPPGLAEAAGSALARDLPCHVVALEHGYHTEWKPVLARVSSAEPDVLLVGLGSPREMKWVKSMRPLLPACLLLTCGGWFGFLAGNERRAPAWLRAVGCEWMFRLVQSPRRLAGRYAYGSLVTAWTALRLLVASGRRSRTGRR